MENAARGIVCISYLCVKVYETQQTLSLFWLNHDVLWEHLYQEKGLWRELAGSNQRIDIIDRPSTQYLRLHYIPPLLHSRYLLRERAVCAAGCSGQFRMRLTHSSMAASRNTNS